jgi:hypothetical protein
MQTATHGPGWFPQIFVAFSRGHGNMPGLASRVSLDNWVIKFETQGKDGLTVKKLFVILMVMGFLAATLSMGASGCKKDESKKASDAPTSTKG